MMFCCGISAINTTYSVERKTGVCVIDANTDQDAYKKGLKFAKENFKAEEGWYDHQLTVFRVPEYVIIKQAKEIIRKRK